MDRSRFKPDIVTSLQRLIGDLQRQVDTLSNQNLALPDWIAPTFVGSWTNFGGSEDNVGYWRSNSGIVFVRGVCKSGSIPGTIFTLPVGFRPLGIRRFCVISAGAVSGYISIDVSGNVSAQAGTNTWLDLAPICFRAEQ